MKIQFLGTAAAEAIPGIFCDCPVCREAREKKGRFVRTRAQQLIDDSLLIDYGPDTYMHSLEYDINLSQIDNVLITHVHDDHFTAQQTQYRTTSFSNAVKNETLTFFGSEDMVAEVMKEPDLVKRFTNQTRVRFHVLKPFETTSVGEYEVTALPARHGTPHPFVYAIIREGKSYLLLNDTGRLLPETYDWLAKSGIVFDAVSFDCTFGFVNTLEKYGEVVGHMGLIDNFAVKQALISQGNIDECTICIVTHFSHNGKDVGYEDMLKHTDTYGFELAYDGMIVEV